MMVIENKKYSKDERGKKKKNKDNFKKNIYCIDVIFGTYNN